VEKFTSKLGKEFVKLHILFNDGTANAELLGKEEYDSFGLDSKKFLDEKELEELFDSAKDNIFKIDYNNRGRIARLS